MRIGIVGNGFVGKATQLLSPSADNSDIQVLVYDIRPDACNPLGTTLRDLECKCDIIFFCLPTPLNHDGTCYTKIVEESIRSVNHPYKVIRSTVPVGFSMKHNCYFMPEFLTEANWRDDFIHSKRWVFGIPVSSPENIENTAHHSRFISIVTELINTSQRINAIKHNTIEILTSNEAEMLKLMKNCFLAAKVGICNEVYELCAATNTDYNRMIDIVKKDERIGHTHTMVPGPDNKRGFGGTCFPKDTHSLYTQLQSHNVRSYIFPAVLTRNDTHDRVEREWASDVWRTTLPRNESNPIAVVMGHNQDVPTLKLDTCAKLINDGYTVVWVDPPKGMSVPSATMNPSVEQSDSEASYNRVITSLDTLQDSERFMLKRSDLASPIFFPHVDQIWFLGFYVEDNYDVIRKVSIIKNLFELCERHPKASVFVVKNASTSQYDSIFAEFIGRCNKEIHNLTFWVV